MLIQHKFIRKIILFRNWSELYPEKNNAINFIELFFSDSDSDTIIRLKIKCFELLLMKNYKL